MLYHRTIAEFKDFNIAGFTPWPTRQIMLKGAYSGQQLAAQNARLIKQRFFGLDNLTEYMKYIEIPLNTKFRFLFSGWT